MRGENPLFFCAKLFRKQNKISRRFLDIVNNLSKEMLEKLSPEERKIALSILGDMSKKGTSKIYDDMKYKDYDEVPVDIITFLHDKRYLGNALYDASGRFTVYPYWEEKLKEIFPTNTTTRYNTLIFTGAIGLGKSFVAVICLLYILYRLLCLHDPYLFYGLQPIDKISISLMNITLDNAKGVALDKMNQIILASPWFMEHGEMAGTSNLIYRPEKHIEVLVASSNNQIIGHCVIANFTDEVNFGLTSDVEKLKAKQKDLISKIDARMASRFLRGNKLPTLNIIASSKNSDQSFLDDYIENKKKNNSSTTLIVDEPQWVVDSRKYTKEHFCIAIGNKYLPNEMLPLDANEEVIEEYKSKGYTKIMEVPIAYLEKFKDNLDGSIMDICGVSLTSGTKYIAGARWCEIKTNKYENPFTQEIIECGTAKDDISQYSDYFDLTKVPSDLKSKPLYIHLDMSKGSGGKGDRTGIAGVYVMGKKPKIEGEDDTKEMFYRVAFHIAIKAPRGYEISFDKHRTFIRWLRNQGFNIKGISSDSFQNGQLSQQLKADGFDYKVISVDRLDSETKIQLQYAYFKSTIYERRLEIYKNNGKIGEALDTEILGLEREGDGHIQHPENGTQGSKDIADSLCGSVWNASLDAEKFAYDYGENLMNMVQLNEDNDYDIKQQLTVDFEKELMNMNKSVNEHRKEVSKENGESVYLMNSDILIF